MVAYPLSQVIAPGARCRVRPLVVQEGHDEGPYGWKCDYLGSVFLVPRRDIVTATDKRMVLVELEARIIRQTGRASSLVEYAGHALRVHAQQVYLQESEGAA